MYYTGLGVPQDDRQAAHWFRMAAAQGHRPAQFYLGTLYAEGQGVEPDPVEALKWVTLAATPPADLTIAARASKFRAELMERMRPEQIAEAERLAAAWRPTPVAVPPRGS